MRLTRIHVDAPLSVGATFELPDGAAAHLVRVLRLQPGDACVLFNGDGHDYDARIAAVGKRGASVQVLDRRAVDNESPLRITLLQGIARGEKMDLVLQKATELGVAEVRPVASERSDVRLDEARAAKRLAHWQQVVAAACEQSGRARVPRVAAPQALSAALEALGGTAAGARWWLDPFADRPVAAVPAGIDACTLAVGPEGGWSPGDRALLQEAGFAGLRLGPRVLRTETAGLAAIAVLQARAGDLR